MVLFRTGFAIDANVPIASTSRGSPADGISNGDNRKRKRAAGSDDPDASRERVSGSSPAHHGSKHGQRPDQKEKEKEKHSQKPGAHTKQSKVEQAAEAEVNIEKLMRQLGALEKTSAAQDGKIKKSKTDPVPTSSKTLASKASSNSRGGESSEGARPEQSTKGAKVKKEHSKAKKKSQQDGKSAQPEFIPDAAALAKREERKRKREAKAAAAASDDNVSTTLIPQDEICAPKTSERNSGSGHSAASSSAVDAVADSGAMTDLQKRMQKKLGGARFRWINEQLYTSEGRDALQLMEDDSSVFEEYHSGFRSQAASWPIQPVHLFITYFQKQYSSSTAQRPVIVDLGCGDAEIASTLVPAGFPVLSYDLVEKMPYIARAQCSQRVPLPGASSLLSDTTKDGLGAIADYVICCLSLMGSDWFGIVREAARILRIGGSFKIAEVSSRFSNIDDFVELVQFAGFKLKTKDTSNSHFIMFDFERIPLHTAASPSLNSLEELEAKARDLLKPCIYKRR